MDDRYFTFVPKQAFLTFPPETKSYVIHTMCITFYKPVLVSNVSINNLQKRGLQREEVGCDTLLLNRAFTSFLAKNNYNDGNGHLRRTRHCLLMSCEITF